MHHHMGILFVHLLVWNLSEEADCNTLYESSISAPSEKGKISLAPQHHVLVSLISGSCNVLILWIHISETVY